MISIHISHHPCAQFPHSCHQIIPLTWHHMIDTNTHSLLNVILHRHPVSSQRTRPYQSDLDFKLSQQERRKDYSVSHSHHRACTSTLDRMYFNIPSHHRRTVNCRDAKWAEFQCNDLSLDQTSKQRQRRWLPLIDWHHGAESPMTSPDDAVMVMPSGERSTFIKVKDH